MYNQWMNYEFANAFRPLAKKLKVSVVARSSRGFMTAYKKAGGNPDNLTDYWFNRRNNFVKRHMAQVKNNNEPLWDADGYPTRRHLALIMWAYSPHTARLLKFLENN